MAINHHYVCQLRCVRCKREGVANLLGDRPNSRTLAWWLCGMNLSEAGTNRGAHKFVNCDSLVNLESEIRKGNTVNIHPASRFVVKQFWRIPMNLKGRDNEPGKSKVFKIPRNEHIKAVLLPGSINSLLTLRKPIPQSSSFQQRLNAKKRFHQIVTLHTILYQNKHVHFYPILRHRAPTR